MLNFRSICNWRMVILDHIAETVRDISLCSPSSSCHSCSSYPKTYGYRGRRGSLLAIINFPAFFIELISSPHSLWTFTKNGWGEKDSASQMFCTVSEVNVKTKLTIAMFQKEMWETSKLAIKLQSQNRYKV